MFIDKNIKDLLYSIFLLISDSQFKCAWIVINIKIQPIRALIHFCVSEVQPVLLLSVYVVL